MEQGSRGRSLKSGGNAGDDFAEAANLERRRRKTRRGRHAGQGLSASLCGVLGYWSGRPNLVASTTTTAAVSGQRAFSTAIVARRCDLMTASVAGLIRLEVIESLRTTRGQRSVVSMVRVEAVIHMAMETLPAAEPWPRTDKYPANKPIRPVVPIRGAVVWLVVEIAVRANWRWTDVYPYRNL